MEKYFIYELSSIFFITPSIQPKQRASSNASPAFNVFTSSVFQIAAKRLHRTGNFSTTTPEFLAGSKAQYIFLHAFPPPSHCSLFALSYHISALFQQGSFLNSTLPWAHHTGPRHLFGAGVLPLFTFKRGAGTPFLTSSAPVLYGGTATLARANLAGKTNMGKEAVLVTLDQLPAGKTAMIRSVGGAGALRRHFLDMGLTPAPGSPCARWPPWATLSRWSCGGTSSPCAWPTPKASRSTACTPPPPRSRRPGAAA